jgi:hypothetical protein
MMLSPSGKLDQLSGLRDLGVEFGISGLLKLHAAPHLFKQDHAALSKSRPQ